MSFTLANATSFALSVTEHPTKKQSRKSKLGQHGNSYQAESDSSRCITSRYAIELNCGSIKEKERGVSSMTKNEILDECDALVPSHIVAAMLAMILDQMNGVIDSTDKGSISSERVIVVAATIRVDAIPGYL